MTRPLRSVLYLPANRASAVAKAREADCDAVILDLEDAVAPVEKDHARAEAAAVVVTGGFGHRLLVVRANAPDSDWGRADLVSLAKAGPAAVLLPKVSDVATLREARSHLPAEIALWAMVETCAAMPDLGTIAREGSALGLQALVVGTNDLALEMRCSLGGGRAAVLPLLTQTVVAARAHGLAAIDGVFNDIADEDGLAAEAAQGALLGFDGKTVIHPRQLETVNAAFAPTDEAVERSRRVAEAFAAPENSGKGVIKVDGKMTELLHLREAERIIAQADAIAARD